MLTHPGLRVRPRILIAPHEIAGQMRLLANTFRRHGFSATSVAYERMHPQREPNDQHLGFDAGTPAVSRFFRSTKFFLYALRQFDVFHFFYGRSLLPRQTDLRILRALGKKVFVHFRGSDIRSIRVDGDIGMLYANQSQRALFARWKRFADGIFVSTPDLLAFAEGAELMPQSLDMSAWEYCDPPCDESQIVVAHAPSSRTVKGTKFVLEAIAEVKRRGYSVRLELFEKVPRSEMAASLARCHIGIDQFLIGSYGHSAIEFMALGRPVIGFLKDWAHPICQEVPIVNTSPKNLAEAIANLIDDRGRRLELGFAGRRFVDKWHSVDAHVARLAEVYTAPSLPGKSCSASQSTTTSN